MIATWTRVMFMFCCCCRCDCAVLRALSWANATRVQLAAIIAVFLRESRRRPICDAEKKLKHEMSTLAEPTAWAMWLFGAAALGAYAHREQLRTGSDSTAAKPQPASSSRPTKDVDRDSKMRKPHRSIVQSTRVATRTQPNISLAMTMWSSRSGANSIT